MSRGLNFRQITIAVLAAIILSGCAVAGQQAKGEQVFTAEQVQTIQPGKTRKEEILQWFGPPLAIARKGGIGMAPRDEDIRTDTFLELFSPKHTIRDEHVVYYFRNLEYRGVSGALLIVGGTQTWTVSEKLWLLIDGRTGIVKDYVFKRQD